MKAQQIRDTYLSFFAERGHKIVPSASLVPSVLDPTVLLTTAGMQPFKPYFLGQETPPAPRLTDVQKCFRTTDIEEVGNTARHLTFFEMLGNWSFGDYFKAESIPWGWELATEGFGMDPEKIWVTVFGGDEELGLGPDTEAIEIWERAGVPAERIVQLGREDNFWQGGPTGPCGPCSELYVDRGARLRRRGRPPRRRHRALPRVLEPRLHVLRPARGRLADRAADEEHRHRHGPRPDGGDPPGRPLGLRRRPRAAADRPRRGALRPHLRRERGGDPGDADRRRPLARRRLPDRRRRRPLERGPRLHPAPDHAPGDPAGQHARPRGALARPLRRARDRADGRRLPGAGRRARDDRPLGERRGGELRPDPGARPGAARAPGRRSARGRDLLDRRGRRLQAARHLRLPLRPDQGAARRAGPGGRRRGLRRADGGAAEPRPHRGGDRARLRGPPRARCRRSPPRPRRAASSATRR